MKPTSFEDAYLRAAIIACVSFRSIFDFCYETTNSKQCLRRHTAVTRGKSRDHKYPIFPTVGTQITKTSHNYKKTPRDTAIYNKIDLEMSIVPAWCDFSRLIPVPKLDLISMVPEIPRVFLCETVTSEQSSGPTGEP